MPRPVWTGALSFGLVNVPVSLFPATEDKSVHFRQLQRGSAGRVRYRRVNEQTGEEVAASDLTHGFDVGGGELVVVDPDELAALAPEKSHLIEISDFVDQRQIDPIYYQRPYYLGPKGEGATRPYGLLTEAMRRSGRVALASFVMRERQHLAVVRVAQDALVLETLSYPDEVRDPAEAVGGPLPAQQPSERELKTAIALIEAMTVDWEPQRYRDELREKVLELVDAKRHGDGVVAPEPAPAASNVVDLMDALQRSLDASTSRGTRAAGA